MLAIAGTAAAAHSPNDAASNSAEPKGSTPAPRAAGEPFDEVYKGRRIQGLPTGGGHHGHAGGFRVLIDGTELHVMQNGDGTWVSLVDHYETFESPLTLACSAVDNLAGADLVADSKTH
ncbi:tyrosinase cofactor [Streptomyces sp. NPDC127178]|uniref:apotyrosinase chaperone MelC1 n=1 Tax=unclassified Streptomyces TaxID=2593676 RepID=UPI003633E828